jgi:hypothetical protein
VLRWTRNDRLSPAYVKAYFHLNLIIDLFSGQPHQECILQDNRHPEAPTLHLIHNQVHSFDGRTTLFVEPYTVHMSGHHVSLWP